MSHSLTINPADDEAESARRALDLLSHSDALFGACGWDVMVHFGDALRINLREVGWKVGIVFEQRYMANIVALYRDRQWPTLVNEWFDDALLGVAGRQAVADLVNLGKLDPTAN